MSHTVGEYRLTELIGEGSFSKVRKAVHVPTGKIYAMKIIKKSNIVDSTQETQVHREIEIMMRMDHPSLIRLHKVLESHRRLFMVLDYAPGGELLNLLIENGAFDEDTARCYFQQLVDAIAYMHERHCVHRDLKPENLLLDERGRLKVADFGLSITAQSSQSLLKTRCGTPYYVAPEVFTADGYIGNPADIWSAGVILYVMLTAQLPFDAPTLEQLAKKIRSGRVVYYPTMPSAAVELIKKILVVTPELRYNIDDIRGHPWFQKNYQPIQKEIEGGSGAQYDEVVQKVGSLPKDSPLNNFMLEEIEEVTAFDVVARVSPVSFNHVLVEKIAVEQTSSFSAQRTKQACVDIISSLATMYNAQIEHVNENMWTITVTIKHDKIVTNVEVLPITDDEAMLVTMTRIQGSEFNFLRFFNAAKQRVAC